MIDSKWKKQTIKAMAAPIHKGNSCTSWKDSLRMATAAFQVFIEQLPDFKKPKTMAEWCSNATIITNANNYRQLTSIKEKNNDR